MAWTTPTAMATYDVFGSSRWNAQVKDNLLMLASLANDGTLAWDNTNKRLGVGTASPTDKLHVTSSSASRTTIKFENTHGTSKSVQFQLGGAGAGVSNFSIGNDLGTNGTKDLYIYDNSVGAARLYISATGSVLIGKTSGLTGAGDLDAAGQISADGNITAKNGFFHTGSALTFFNGSSSGKQTVTGSRGGNAALNTLLLALASYGLITNSSTA